MKLLVFGLLLFSLFHTSQGTYIGKNFVYWYHELPNNITQYSLWNRWGKNGYAFIAFSARNDTWKDALVILSYQFEDAFFQKRMEGRNGTYPLQNVASDNDNKLVLLYRDANKYPINEYGQDFMMRFQVNRTLFTKLYGKTPFVYVGVCKDGRPDDNTVFRPEMTMNEMFSNDKYMDVVFYSPVFRLEVLHESIFYISLIFYVVLGFILLLFSRHQPLASRGLTPFLSIVTQFMLLLSSGIPVFYLDFHQTIRMRAIPYIFGLINYPFIMTLLALVLNSYTRYMILVYLTQKKVDFVNKDMKIGKTFIILNIIGKWWFNLITITLFYAILCVFNVVLFILVPQAIDYILLPPLIILGLFGCLLFFIDFVLNLKLICTCNFSELWRLDSLSIKSEIFLTIGISFPLYFIYYILDITKSNILAKGFIISLCFFNILFWQCIFPLLLTLLNILRNLTKKKEPVNIMKNVLDDEKGYQLLFEFAQTEFSIENVACWKDIKEYKNEDDPTVKKQLSREIFNKYLNGSNSQLEVNIPQNYCTEVLSKIETGIVVKTLFDKVEDVLYTNISDTYSRFKLTRECKTFEKQQQFVSSFYKGSQVKI